MKNVYSSRSKSQFKLVILGVIVAGATTIATIPTKVNANPAQSGEGVENDLSVSPSIDRFWSTDDSNNWKLRFTGPYNANLYVDYLVENTTSSGGTSGRFYLPAGGHYTVEVYTPKNLNPIINAHGHVSTY